MIEEYAVSVFSGKLYSSTIARQRQNQHSIVFAPRNGRCWSCRRDIYRLYEYGDTYSGIDIETATEKVVSGCPHCKHSFVE